MDVGSGKEGDGSSAPVDALLPTKLRTAAYALMIAATIDTVAFFTAGETAVRASYGGMIVVYLGLLALAKGIGYGPRFEAYALSGVSTGLVARYGLLVFTAPELVGSGSDLLATYAGLMTMYLLAFITFDKRVASAASIAILVSVITTFVVAARHAGIEITVEGQPHIRTFAVHAIAIALLYVLSAFKEQLQRSQAETSALTVMVGTDELTGLANRRRLTATLERELTLAAESDTALSVVLIDIDHFKSVNDNHGHAVGDAVLEETGTILDHSSRASDLAGRWGGEEFLIVAPGADHDEARQLAERCRQNLRRHVFSGVGTVTASFGVATRLPGDDADALVGRADRALYVAKGTGRDRVEVATTTPLPPPLRPPALEPASTPATTPIPTTKAG